MERSPAASSDAAVRTPWNAPRLRFGAVVGAGTAWATDDAGVNVEQGLAGGVSGGAGWMVGGGYGLGLGLRGTLGAVTIDDEEGSRSAGTATQVDLLASIEHALGDRLAGHVAAGAAWVSGPDDVVPFRHGNNGRLQPTGEVGLALRLTTGRPLSATFALQATRFGSATLADPIKEPGWVNRGLVGVRYGR